MNREELKASFDDQETMWEAEEWIEGATMKPEIRKMLTDLLRIAKHGMCPTCGVVVVTREAPVACDTCAERTRVAVEDAHERLKDIFK